MAYIDQTKKASIAAALKRVIPAGWKYSLAIRHHSTLVLTITAAPFDLLRAVKASDHYNPETATRFDVNEHHIRGQFDDECVADTLETILAALNEGNHDRNDIQSDYFDVGWYVDIKIGRWDKPFTVVPVTGKVVAA